MKTIQKNERSAQGGLRRTLLISHNQHNHIQSSFHYAHFYLGPACIAFEYDTVHSEAGKGPTLPISAPHFNRYSFIHGCRIQGAPASYIIRVLGYSGELINMSHTPLHSSTVSNLQESGRKQSIQKPTYLSTPTDSTATGPSMIRAILTSARHWRSLEEWAVGLNQPSIQPSLFLQDESDAKLKCHPTKDIREMVCKTLALLNHRRSRLSAPMLLLHAGGLDKIKISRENSILTI